MSVGGALWVLVLLARILRGRDDPPGSDRQPVGVDNWALVLTLVQAVAVIVLVASLGYGWTQLFIALWLVLVFPHWAAWRVCQPLGLRRPGILLINLVRGGGVEREGRRRLFEWSLGHPDSRFSFEDELPVTFRRWTGETSLVPADGWTTCAAALRAEAIGDVAQADRLVRGLLHLPARPRLPRTVARLGFELLAFAALSREDMPSVMARASAGRGRGCRLLRLLARARIVGDVPARSLWLAWALAPRRRHTLPWVREVPSPRPEMAGSGADAPDLSPWSRHVGLLDRAARGERVERTQVMRLASEWDGPLGPAGQARLRARAQELGVVDPEAACRAVEATVLSDLEALGATAEGTWPPGASADGEGLPALLMAGVADQLYSELEPWVAPYRVDEVTDVQYPLVEWDRWLAFRSTLDRLEEALGEDALSTSWYGGLRLAAWNWPCRLLEVHQQRAAWICHVMFDWTLAMAERLGDEEAATVNRRNVKAAAGKMPH